MAIFAVVAPLILDAASRRLGRSNERPRWVVPLIVCFELALAVGAYFLVQYYT